MTFIIIRQRAGARKPETRARRHAPHKTTKHRGERGMNAWTKRILALALAVLAVLTLPALAQSDGGFPSRPIRLVVPFGAGGGNDLLARVIAQHLQAKWGQPVLVENKPGAGGNIGAEFVAKATPDGYTLLLATNTLTINPAMFLKMPFDVRQDFAPVALAAATPFVLLVSNDLPVKSVRELVALAREKPGRLSYASVGVGTPHHLGMELFKNLTGTDIVHVPYKGSVAALTDLAGGRVQVMLASINAAMPLMQAGKVRAIAIAEPKRIDSARELPTVIEAGVPGYEITAWYAVFAPARTPGDIVRKLSDEILRGMEGNDTRDKLRPAGFEIVRGNPAELRALIASDLDKWAGVVKAAGIKPE
jgi:tripartite-type tricarboxylate transporter receptor subunit TctC